MKAKQARERYFEYFVEFEHKLRTLYREMTGETTRNKSLSSIIEEISTAKNLGYIGVSKKYLENCNWTRNWLAHRHANETAPQHRIEIFERASEMSGILSVAITRSRHKKTTS